MHKTILIIDDDDILRRTLARGLQSEQFNVLTADSAESGAEILSRIRVDAIVLDRMMTGRDGLTFLQDLRAHGNDTPVIMLTAMAGPENTIDGLAGGANDYLAKPFQLRELVLRLNNIIRTDTNSLDFTLPAGLILVDGEFFVSPTNIPNATPRVLGLSGEEKKLLMHLTSPVGNIAPASPMVAKRLRMKLNGVLSSMDIVTIRGRGYKLVTGQTTTDRGNA